MASAAIQRLREVLPNARDLSEAFPAIPPGRLIRCANPSSTLPEHVDFLLAELRVRDLIDLRSGEEMEEDDPGSALMARAVVREYRRAWLRPGQLLARPDRPPQNATAAAANGAAASRYAAPDPSGSAPSTQAGDPPGATAATSHSGAAPHSAPSPSSPSSPSSPTATANGTAASNGGGPSASAVASTATVVRHHISLLDRGRYYLSLAGRLPARTTAAAALTNLVSKPRARALLLPYVNGGGLGLLYEMLLESAGPELCQVMEVLLAAAESRHAAIFFCRAGKDRTGLVAAAVLSVAGASEEEVVADYARSDAFHQVALAGLEKREELAGLDRAQFERAPPEVMRGTLEHVRSRYGSFSGYLTSVGFGPDKQRRLRELLTAPW
ncbi:hypothetical protein GPECTOR_1g311 [Gonium pectorale]|uniref:Tyrosine specific protein phosphatases domain-containing protein n=1 Tax=Gonium pectorale TaxID=33097 RepID=A0A150H2Y9_GONPE|nr:hypothetical protein GPECTOR_1g311 [Gonium pectorale]|eukprot:KXZ56352.1 hypothetical protein GPECTOR_1g311 [Gonium pectorale]